MELEYLQKRPNRLYFVDEYFTSFEFYFYKFVIL